MGRMFRHVGIKHREEFHEHEKHVDAHGIGDDDSQFLDGFFARVELTDLSQNETEQNE